MNRCVFCERLLWFWTKKRYFKMPDYLNPCEIEEGWCHEECEVEHLRFLVKDYLRVQRIYSGVTYDKALAGDGSKGMAQSFYSLGIPTLLLDKFTEEELKMVLQHESDENLVGYG